MKRIFFLSLAQVSERFIASLSFFIFGILLSVFALISPKRAYYSMYVTGMRYRDWQRFDPLGVRTKSNIQSNILKV